jgi:hypothetical protein
MMNDKDYLLIKYLELRELGCTLRRWGGELGLEEDLLNGVFRVPLVEDLIDLVGILECITMGDHHSRIKFAALYLREKFMPV